MIIGSGTFTLAGPGLLNVSGDFTWSPGGGLPAFVFDAGISGNNKVGTMSAGWLAGHSILTLSGSGPWSGAHFIENVPAGFTPTTNLEAAVIHDLGFLNAADTVTQRVAGFESSRTGISSLPPDHVLIDDDTSWVLLSTGLIEVEANLVGQPLTAGSGLSTGQSFILLTGNYDIVLYWWTIPDVSVCGDRAESHLQLTDDDPGAPWVRLDPDDPDAAPDPTIDSIQPDHGVIAGGTAIEIHGSGFGDGCTVTIGGAPATSVVVVSQYLITCVTPAHAAGTATVVVTNEDGATS